MTNLLIKMIQIMQHYSPQFQNYLQINDSQFILEKSFCNQ